MDDTFFRTLTPEEEEQFRLWVRQWIQENPNRLNEPVNPTWHPVIKDELMKLKELRDTF